MNRKLGIVVLWLTLSFMLALPVNAQGPTIQIISESIDSQFREEITAQLLVEHDVEIINVEFFYRVVGQRATARNVADFEPGTQVEASYTIEQDRPETYMPPGTELEYWWKLTDADENSIKTEPQFYLYLDNRFDFKELHSERLTLYWYSGGRSFGDSLFRQANTALKQLEEGVGVTIENPIKIFIYGNHEDLVNALSVSSQEWTGGVAYTEYGVVVIGVRPDNLSWGLKAMTHELTHLIIHQATDNPYSDLPTWLNEGLAVYNESPEGLDEQFSERFQEAVKNDALMSLQTLSSTFPADPEAANLAYGQSGAVVHFILDAYGIQAMAKLLAIFSEGALADKALMEALGEDTQSLDDAFREHWGLSTLKDDAASNNQSEAQTTGTEKPDTQQEETTQTEEKAPTDTQSEGTQQDQANIDSAKQTTETRGRLGLSCLGGIVPLLALGLLATRRRRRLS